MTQKKQPSKLHCRSTGFWRQHLVLEHTAINVANSDRIFLVCPHVDLACDVRIATNHKHRCIRALNLHNILHCYAQLTIINVASTTSARGVRLLAEQ